MGYGSAAHLVEVIEVGGPVLDGSLDDLVVEALLLEVAVELEIVGLGRAHGVSSIRMAFSGQLATAGAPPTRAPAPRCRHPARHRCRCRRVRRRPGPRRSSVRAPGRRPGRRAPSCGCLPVAILPDRGPPAQIRCPKSRAIPIGFCVGSGCSGSHFYQNRGQASSASFCWRPTRSCSGSPASSRRSRTVRIVQRSGARSGSSSSSHSIGTDTGAGPDGR